jgi:putative colanic acid biosynthesis glycosyltransferase
MKTSASTLDPRPQSTAPLISIISITLNDRDGLTRTIKSLQAQVDAPQVEHIIIDGMSDYDVAGLLAELGSNATLHQGQDAGLYDAMNRGTDLARGDYLLYLNGGDVLADKDVLAKLGAVLTRERPDFLFGDSLEKQLDGEIRYKPSRPIKRLPLGMITHHQAMVFRRAVIEENAIRYDLNYRIAADYDFVLKHVRASETIRYLPEPICVFERGGASYKKSKDGRREQFHIRRAAYHSTSFAAAIFVTQWALFTFRNLFPSAYWTLQNQIGKI